MITGALHTAKRKALSCVLSLLLVTCLVPVVPSSFAYAADGSGVSSGSESAAASSSSEQQVSYASDEILVVFNDGVSAEQAESSLLSMDAVDESSVSAAVAEAVEDTSAYLSFDSESDSSESTDTQFSALSAADDDLGGAIVEVALDADTSVEEAIAQAQSDPAVAYAQPNYEIV